MKLIQMKLKNISFKRLFTLLGKELLHGPRGFILVIVVGAPLLITLAINLAVGDLFSGTPRLAVYDEGNSRLVKILDEAPQVDVKYYDSNSTLRNVVERGAADAGIMIPATLDDDIAAGENGSVTLYIWGESLAKDRLVITSTVLQAARDIIADAEAVNLEQVTLGDEVNIPWSRRLMPFTVMMAVFFGGLMMPAVSLIVEKQKRTLQSIAATPATYGDIFISKGIVGALLSLVMGIIILLINQAWGESPIYLLGMLVIAAVMAAELGLILGTTIRDMNTMFAVWKFGGILLFGPAVVYMFPQLPQWLGYIFPTYYIVRPIMDITFGTADTTTLALAGVSIVFVLILAVIQGRLVSRLSGEGPRQTVGQAEA
jgi:ABC-2 type transport system permease protein